jgi:murein DD-endopeptidase MepM/ murein hydrolase activator NlpD
MSSAKRTPRYVDAIRPFEVVERSASADVIRLRPEPLGPALPPITEHWPRAKAVPLAQRPWQLLLVPPTPGAPTRGFNIARWQARLVLGLAAVVLLIAAAGATALVLAVRSPELFATSAEAALLRARLTVVEDSLALARSELEAPDDTLASALLGGAIPNTSSPSSAGKTTKLTAGAKPLARRSSRSASDDDSELTARGIEGLPVIGAIASRFSRARRHPLLHIVRPHLGVDLAAPRGTQITAPAAGVVSFVGRKFGFGLVVEIDHGNGVTTRYAHCGRAMVAVGARVTHGTPLATIGTSGLSTGPHLHYEVLIRGHQVDPLKYRLLQPMPDSAVPPAAPAPAPPPVTVPAAPVQQAGAPVPATPAATPTNVPSRP